MTQHERCEIRVTIDGPATDDTVTILTGAMVDDPSGANIDRKGNVGQWDLMQEGGRHEA